MNKKELIPRTIHYCWFGGGAKNSKIIKCMNSWKKHLSDYQIIEWNEDNFDISSNQYVKQAYEAKKYAFVSDVVRLHALYHVGGIYLDTDVEVIQSLDPFLEHEVFSGYEDETWLQSGTMGATKSHAWVQGLLEQYENRNFILPDGSLDLTTNTSMITAYCSRFGLRKDGSFQKLEEQGVVFYPRIYFSPYDYINGASYITNESYTIHHFDKSWLPAHVRWRSKLKRLMGKYAGPQFVAKMREIFK